MSGVFSEVVSGVLCHACALWHWAGVISGMGCYPYQPLRLQTVGMTPGARLVGAHLWLPPHLGLPLCPHARIIYLRLTLIFLLGLLFDEYA